MFKHILDPDHATDNFSFPPWALVSLILVSSFAACMVATLTGIGIWSVATLAFR